MFYFRHVFDLRNTVVLHVAQSLLTLQTHLWKDTLYSCMNRCFIVIFTMQFWGLFLFYRGSEKCTAKPTEGYLKSPLKKGRCYLNTDLLEAWLRFPTSWRLKKIFKVSTLSFQTSTAGDRLMGPCFLSHCWVALFTNISYVTSLHSSGKMWICRLGFI